MTHGYMILHSLFPLLVARLPAVHSHWTRPFPSLQPCHFRLYPFSCRKNGHNIQATTGMKMEDPVFKREKTETVMHDEIAMTRKRKKKEDFRLESLPVKKRIDLISQSEPFNAYSMPVFRKT